MKELFFILKLKSIELNIYGDKKHNQLILEIFEILCESFNFFFFF
jgi:hypothetical protein